MTDLATSTLITESINTPAHRDTARAQHELQTAYGYIAQYENEENSEKKAELLKFAAMRIAQSRKLDPDTEITVSDEHGTRTYKNDHLAALALFIEGVSLMHNEHRQHQALVALEKAVSLNAYSANMLCSLARLYTLLFRRDDALKAFQRAVELEPTNIEAQRLLDKMNANPNIGVQPSIFQRAPGLFIGLGWTGVVVGLAMWLFGNPLGMVLAIVSLLVAIGFRFVETSNMRLDATEEIKGHSTRKL